MSADMIGIILLVHSWIQLRINNLFLTFLHDPVIRFLSELKHVSRQGYPWK